MKNSKSGQLNISFGLIFAIIVGAFILFLTIYGVYKFIGIQETQQSAESGRSIEILLNPLETGFETGQKVEINSLSETRILITCDDEGVFGKQDIKTQQKNFNSYTDDENTIKVSTESRYIFSEYPIEGKRFIAFSKPYEFPSDKSYEFPFKIADAIYITSYDVKYCFVKAPEEIEMEIKNIGQENIFFGSNCTETMTRVCFSPDNNCDMVIDENSGYIEKDSKRVYFEGNALMYAGIFSYPEEYECNIKRLMKRAEQLTIIYREKSILQRNSGCEGSLEEELGLLENLLDGFSSSRDIFEVGSQARRINSLNSNLGDCKLW